MIFILNKITKNNEHVGGQMEFLYAHVGIGARRLTKCFCFGHQHVFGKHFLYSGTLLVVWLFGCGGLPCNMTLQSYAVRFWVTSRVSGGGRQMKVSRVFSDWEQRMVSLHMPSKSYADRFWSTSRVSGVRGKGEPPCIWSNVQLAC